MLKKELIKRKIELENEIHRLEKLLEKLLPNSKTDGYIKNCRNKVESFKFSYTVPSLDWFETKNVEIAYDDYYYFRLEKRFCPNWWLIGLNGYDTPDYHWKETSLGNLSNNDLKRFIKWTKSLQERGNPITEIKVISGDFDILKELKELLEFEKEVRE